MFTTKNHKSHKPLLRKSSQLIQKVSEKVQQHRFQAKQVTSEKPVQWQEVKKRSRNSPTQLPSATLNSHQFASSPRQTPKKQQHPKRQEEPGVPPARRAESSAPPARQAESPVPPARRAESPVTPARRAESPVTPARRAESPEPCQPVNNHQLTYW
uniref:Uncharacterized protein n=1 Tax=Caenorhabditis japonica TaxID=281687 RepID=A0A8R1IAQ9_CAEJA